MTDKAPTPPPSNPSALPRVLSAHALARYRQRVDPAAAVQGVEDVLERGRYQPMLPGWMMTKRNIGGVVIGPGCAFIMAVHGKELHAITCLSKRRIPKADRRAHREHARAEPFT